MRAYTIGFLASLFPLLGCLPAVDAEAPTEGEGDPTSGEEDRFDSGDADGIEDSDGADDSDGLGGSGESDGSGGADGSGGSDGASGLETPVVAGVWRLADESVVEDPCGWNRLLANGLDLTLADMLPSTFDVEAYAAGFRIKARNYGAQDTIDCSLSGDDFTCTLQTVSAQQVTSGWPTYWTYEIDFRGNVVNERTIAGRATVEFPVVNPGDAFQLGLAFMDPSECGQAFDLTLVASDE